MAEVPNKPQRARLDTPRFRAELIEEIDRGTIAHERSASTLGRLIAGLFPKYLRVLVRYPSLLHALWQDALAIQKGGDATTTKPTTATATEEL